MSNSSEDQWHIEREARIQVGKRDLQALKRAWFEMSDEAEEKITCLADMQPDTPIGVAFVDAAGRPGWPGDTPGLTIHHPSIRGCLPRVGGLEPEIPRGTKPTN